MLAHIPLWVFGVLVAILAAGLSQRRTRVRRPFTVMAVALALAAWSLSGVVSAFDASLATVGPWGLGLVLGALAALGLGVGRGMAARAGGSLVQVPGSWTPLALMLGIFVLRFALGMAQALGAALPAGGLGAMAVVALLGALGGAFIARALAVWRVSLAASDAAYRWDRTQAS